MNIRPKVLNRIKKLRWEQNISVRDLANLTGVSHAHITELENFRAIPTQIVMMKLAKGFNKKVGEVFLLDYTKLDL